MHKAVARAERYSPAIEDYVKAIYQLAQQHDPVSTSLLAEYLAVTPASVTGMVQKLARLDLVAHTPYRGVALTERGTATALEVLRHHRLIELFLVETLHYSWDEVHAEAEVLEHAISEQLEARIAERLGHPVADPHGDPIPHADLSVPADGSQPLTELPVGAWAQIIRVLDQDPAHLRYFQQLQLVPGTCVVVRARAPFDGPVTVALGTTEIVLDSRLARSILVCTGDSTDQTNEMTRLPS